MSDRADDDDAVFRASQQGDLAGLAGFVERVCVRAGAGPEAISDVRLAAEEVFANILQHGYGGATGPVTVRIDTTQDRITVTLTDEAPAFDPAGVAAPDLDADWEQRSPGGLGWHLVTQVMDEARCEPAPGGGNMFTLVRRLALPDTSST